MGDPALESFELLCTLLHIFIGNAPCLFWLHNKKHMIQARFINDYHFLHSARGSDLRIPLFVIIQILHDPVSVGFAEGLTNIFGDPPRLVVNHHRSDFSISFIWLFSFRFYLLEMLAALLARLAVFTSWIGAMPAVIWLFFYPAVADLPQLGRAISAKVYIIRNSRFTVWTLHHVTPFRHCHQR